KNGVSKLPVKLSEPKTYVLETAIYYFLIPENTNLETGPNNGDWSLMCSALFRLIFKFKPSYHDGVCAFRGCCHLAIQSQAITNCGYRWDTESSNLPFVISFA
ncbi:MAG: hypothetical protein V3W20_07255, partial [Candidatus Neomarinimicrobiota bacterium]